MNLRCGDRLELTARLVNARGIILAESQHTQWKGQLGAEETILLLGIGNHTREARIPEDGTSLSSRFKRALEPNQIITALDALLEVNHPFADDLVLSVQPLGAPARDLLRGHEEVEFPGRVSIPLSNSRAPLNLSVSLRDITPGISGSLRRLDLEIKTIRLGCEI